MAAEFVDAASNGANTTALSVTIPGGAVAGDVALIGWAYSDTATGTNPAGWTQADDGAISSLHYRLLWRLLGAGEAGATVTLTNDVANKQSALLALVRGVDTSAPLSADSPAAATDGSSDTVRLIPDATLTASRLCLTWVVARGSVQLADWTPSTPWTRAAQVFTAPSGETNGALGWREADAGALDGGTWTSDVADARAATLLVALTSAPTGSINSVEWGGRTVYVTTSDTSGEASWDFGDDGPPDVGVVKSHAYAADGLYTIRLLSDGTPVDTVTGWATGSVRSLAPTPSRELLVSDLDVPPLGGLSLLELLDPDNTLTTVTTTRAATWNTTATTAATRTTSWHTLVPATTNRATTWTTLVAVQTTRPASWAVLAAVSASRATAWHTLAAAQATRAASWAVLAGLAASRATTWHTATGVQASRTATWSAAATVTATRATGWNVAGTLATITTTRTAAWDTRTAVATVRETRWDVLASTTIARLLLWTVLSRITTDRGTGWTVLSHDWRDLTLTATEPARALIAALSPADRITASSPTRPLITAGHPGRRLTTDEPTRARITAERD